MAKTSEAHCNTCGGERTHEILHSVPNHWHNEEASISGKEVFDMLKCRGCDAVTLRHTSSSSEDQEDTVRYYPPAIFRRPPSWFDDLWMVLSQRDDFVRKLLEEVYVAVQNNLPRLAAMGIRALIERIMISKVRDQRTFARNLEEFEKAGFVSQVQRRQLEAILEAGHAAIHRVFTPSSEDVITLVDIAEQIVATVYVYPTKVTALKKRVPRRPSRKRKAANSGT